jgi:hypothetical protein
MVNRYAKRHAGALKSNDKEAGLRALIRGADSASHDLTRLASDANYGTEFSNIQMLTNKITGETRLIVITMIIQALILEQMSVTIFMESTNKQWG